MSCQRLTPKARHLNALGVREEERHYAAAIVAVVAAVVAAGVAAYSAYNQNQNQQDQLKYNQKVATANARAADDAAAANAEVQRERAAHFLASQRAAVGATGGTFDSGSALSLMADSAYNAEMDAQKLLYEGHYKAWQYDTAAAGYRWQRMKLADQQWTNTLLTGASAGLSTYAGAGGFGQNSLLNSPPTAPTTTVGGYGAGEQLKIGRVPQYGGMP